ncbi:MAG: SsrA-binding protein SmpB [Sulfuricurvum sp.]
MGENIANNKKAFFDYHIEEKFEAGLELMGSEVKALRAGRVNLKDGFIKIIKGEAFVFNVHISRLETTHRHYGHEERRSRKLLLHRKQIDKMFKAVEKEGFTLVPLSIYFNDRNIAKMQVAIAKGKKLYDKRDDLKEKTIKRDIERSLKGE